MRFRPLIDSDVPVLREMFERSGFEYTLPDLRGPLMESVIVVADENDQPVAAAAAERIVQLFLFIKEDEHPAAKLHWIKMLHEGLATELRTKGYHSCDAFLPPQVEKSFGRRLMRNFGWVRNWNSFARHF
jgi:hypothetical protein